MTSLTASAHRIAAIAWHNFREAVRDRVFYNLIAFVALVAGAALLASQISIGIERELVVNLGLAAISLTTAVLGVLLGVSLVSKEMGRRTLYAVLTRPVRRWELLGGNFCGLAATLAANTVVMGVAFAVVMAAMAARTPEVSWPVMPVACAIYFLLLQALILVALALLFSSFSSPLLAALFTLALFVIGSFADDLRSLAAMASGGAGWLPSAIAYALPDLSSLNVSASVAHGQAVSLHLVALNTLYAALYSSAALGGAAMIFARRELQ